MSVTSMQSKWIVRSLLAAVLILAILPTRAATVLVMGDSLSAGYGIDPQDGWVSLLAQRLDEQDASHQVINASISGETSRGGLDRLPALLQQHQPDLVLLELGANDGLRGYPVPRITTNLSRMIELSQRAGAEYRAVFPAIRGTGRPVRAALSAILTRRRGADRCPDAGRWLAPNDRCPAPGPGQCMAAGRRCPEREVILTERLQRFGKRL